MTKFKIGDRVVYTPDGMTGTIAEVYDDGFYEVDFDDDTNDCMRGEDLRHSRVLVPVREKDLITVQEEIRKTLKKELPNIVGKDRYTDEMPNKFFNHPIS